MFLCPASWQASVTDVLRVQFVYLIHDLMLASERNISNDDQDRMAVTGPKMSRLCWTEQENLLINCVLNPFGFVIDRIILAVFSNFYLHHGYSNQPTFLNLSSYRGTQHLNVLRTTSIVLITCSHRWTLPVPKESDTTTLCWGGYLRFHGTLTEQEPTKQNDEYKTAIKTLSDYFEPQKYVDHHVYVLFCQKKQNSGESMTEFYTRLQMLLRKCEFADTEWEIKRQITQGISSVKPSNKTST